MTKPKVDKFSVQDDEYILQAKKEGASFGAIGKYLKKKASACRYRHDKLVAPVTHNQRIFVAAKFKEIGNIEKTQNLFYKKYNKRINAEEIESIIWASKSVSPVTIQKIKEYPCCWHNCRLFALPNNSYCYIHHPRK